MIIPTQVPDHNKLCIAERYEKDLHIPKTIAVLGATGNQGKSVATHFLSLDWNVRDITRNVSSPSSQALSSRGIRMVEADIDNPSSLLTAFRGAHIIFAVTDFWSPFFASFGERKKISDRATGEHACAIEVRRGNMIIDAVAQVMREEGSALERFIFSTFPVFKGLSGGKHSYVYYFDSKAEVSAYLKQRDDGKLWEKSSLSNMGFYMTNLLEYGEVVGAVKVGHLFSSQNISRNCRR